LRYIEKYDRWYCDACKIYAPKEEKQKAPEVPPPKTVEVPVQEAQPAAKPAEPAPQSQPVAAAPPGSKSTDESSLKE
jgi:hypothetical protein